MTRYATGSDAAVCYANIRWDKTACGRATDAPEVLFSLDPFDATCELCIVAWDEQTFGRHPEIGGDR